MTLIQAADPYLSSNIQRRKKITLKDRDLKSLHKRDRSALDELLEILDSKETPELLEQIEIYTSQGRITQLDLSNTKTGLSYIPDCINELTYLSTLNLDENGVFEIEHLDNLSYLTELSLRDCGIEEIEELDTLTNLQVLDLSFNPITRIQNLDNLLNLRSLSLSFTQIERIAGMSHLQKLEYLDLSGCSITCIERLHNLRTLQHLNLQTNEISSLEGLEKLNTLDNLRTIELFENPINRDSPATRTVLKQLHDRGVEIDIYTELNEG